LKKLGRRVEAFLHFCLVCCAKQLPMPPLGAGVLPAWPGVRAAGERRSSSQKPSYGRNAKLGSTLAAGPFFIFMCLLSLSSEGVNLQIDPKDAKGGHPWVNEQHFQPQS